MEGFRAPLVPRVAFGSHSGGSPHGSSWRSRVRWSFRQSRNHPVGTSFHASSYVGLRSGSSSCHRKRKWKLLDCRYRPLRLFGLGDCNYPLGRARINADRLVAGTWQDPTDYIDRAFVYDTTLTTLGYGTGGGINTNGVTTGYLYFDPDEGLTPPGAFRYSDETITNLGFPA